jgi:hypothetical protein
MSGSASLRGAGSLELPHARGLNSGSAEGDPVAEATLQRLSHDLRTPLNAILGNVELLLEGTLGPLSAPARSCLADVQLAGRQLTGHIRTLLLLVEVAGGGAQVAAGGAVDVLALLRRYLHRAGRARLPLEVRPADAGLVLWGDRPWLETMAEALAEIVAQSRPRSSTLELTLERPAGDSAGVRLSVVWKAFDPVQLPVAPLALLRAVLQLHGATLASDDERGLVIDWPAERLVGTDGGKAPPADASSRERG